MNTEERFLLRSSVEWRKNLMQDCLCMPCAEFSDSFDAAVDAAIATFPELEREAILKRYRDGLTPTQCANALEIDIGKFHSCFDLAIRRLRHPKYAGGILKEMRRFAGSPLASALKEAIENGNWKKSRSCAILFRFSASISRLAPRTALCSVVPKVSAMLFD